MRPDVLFRASLNSSGHVVRDLTLKKVVLDYRLSLSLVILRI